MKKLILLIFITLLYAHACAQTPAPAVNLNIIAQIESSNNPLAYNRHSKASGMYQLTPMAWLDVQNNFPDLRRYPFAYAFNPKMALLFAKAYFIIIDRYLIHYKLKLTLQNRLACYNQGIGLTRKGVMSKETANYIKKYILLDKSR